MILMDFPEKKLKGPCNIRDDECAVENIPFPHKSPKSSKSNHILVANALPP